MTTVEQDTVTTVHYRGTFPASGKEFDNSHGSDPLTFLVGHGNMVLGFEQGLLGASVGDEREFTLTPEDAYGKRDEEQVVRIDKAQFEGMDISVGLTLVAETEGSHSAFTVMEIGDEDVTVDFNHPLAGETLHFNVEIVEVRDALPEELEHGHVHGPGGHHH
jgi:FKBP-type peptidyl-prolyl cis-trans isomerase SlyD